MINLNIMCSFEIRSSPKPEGNINHMNVRQKRKCIHRLEPWTDELLAPCMAEVAIPFASRLETSCSDQLFEIRYDEIKSCLQPYFCSLNMFL